MPPQKETRITVLISGSGTNLQALIDAQPTNKTPSQNQTTPLLPPTTKITHVISNKKSAHGLTRAQTASIQTTYHNLLKYKKDPQYAGNDKTFRRAYDEDLAALVLREEVDLVVCAGFMHVLGEGFLGPLEKKGVKIINLHPGMLSFMPFLILERG